MQPDAVQALVEKPFPVVAHPLPADRQGKRRMKKVAEMQKQFIDPQLGGAIGTLGILQSELAAEMWQHAMRRWTERNAEPVRLPDVVQEPISLPDTVRA